MNLQEAVASLVLLSFAANAADWLLVRRTGFFSLPRSGRSGQFFAACSILLAALAALSLFDVLPVLFLVVAGGGWMISSQAYAIFSRHRKAKVAP